MKIKITESELNNIIRKVIKEDEWDDQNNLYNDFLKISNDFIRKVGKPIIMGDTKDINIVIRTLESVLRKFESLKEVRQGEK
jgi:CO dehydrogenase/acetyl-CoA synthase alpha subunit